MIKKILKYFFWLQIFTLYSVYLLMVFNQHIETMLRHKS